MLMQNDPSASANQASEKLVQYSNLFVGCVLLLGISVLVGWQFNIGILKSPLPDMIAMNPMTALGFLASGFSITLLTKHARYNFLYYTLALVCLVAGLLKLGDTIFHSDIGIDQLLFSDKLSVNTPNNTPNRMAPNTAFSFVLTAIALLIIPMERKRKYIPSQFVALMIAFIMLLSIVGYLYHVKAFYGLFSYTPMAIHTAIGFFLIALAILFHSSSKGIMLILTSDFEGSANARLLIPAAILIPILLGYLRLLGQWENLYSNEFGVSLLIVTIIVAFIALIWHNSSLLNTRDKLRSDAEYKVTELNEELTQTNSQLANMNNDLEAFTYSVSHDLKAPLRTVISYVNVIDEDYGNTLDPDGRALLKKVSVNASKMHTLITDLLAFSTLESVDIKKTEINMKALVENIWEDINKASPRHTELRMRAMHSVHADPALLQQVIVNLISNAVKYSSKKEKPVVDISAEIKADVVVYKISDNGAGFDMDHAHKLFNVFQRLHLSNDFEGTGIGLAIVQRIISKHQGKVWAEASPGVGATFYFTLPRA